MIGSFLNVCIYRLPLGQSIVFPPRGACAAASALRWYQNMPVLSWLVLRGRCAYCGDADLGPLSGGRALTGVVFALHAFVFEPGPLLARAAGVRGAC